MISEINKGLVLFALVGLLFFFGLYHLAALMRLNWSWESYHFAPVSLDYINNVALSISAAIVIFIFTGGLLKRYNSMAVQEQTRMIKGLIEDIFHMRPPSDFNEFNWREAIHTSTHIRVNVHYLGSWINTYSKDLVKFFAKGGAFEYFVPNPENKSVMRAISTRLGSTNSKELIDKIQTSVMKLEKLAAEAGESSHEAMSVIYLDRVSWTCLMAFDNQVVLSPYELLDQVGVRAPVIPLSTKNSEVLQEWVNREFRPN